MEGITIPSYFMDSLEQSMLSMAVQGADVRGVAYQDLLRTVRDSARAIPQWAPLADEIDVWDEHDRTWIGIRGPNFASEAFEAEYGTENMAPTGFMRTVVPQHVQAAERSIAGRRFDPLAVVV